MIAVDTNILVYAHRLDSDSYEEADRALTELAESGRPWAIPWPCIHEFFAITTHPRVFDAPSTSQQAREQIRCWLEAPTLTLLAEGAGYWGVLEELLSESRVVGPRVHDARIAALCLLHGVRELWTADRDFGRFSRLRTRNPVTGATPRP